jgi:hypothetical protein
MLAGESRQAVLRIGNEGNARFKALLMPLVSRGFSVAVEPEVVDLAPGETAVLKMNIDASERIMDFRNVIVHIKAVDLEGNRQVRLGEISQGLGIFPRESGSVNLQRTLPASLLLRHIGNGDDSDYQFQISGGGAIDDAGRRVVDFMARSPDQKQFSPFAQREEYRLNYSDDDFSLRIGDQSYCLSYLTDYYRYGRGLEITGNIDAATKAGLYLLDNHLNSPRTRQRGFFVSRELSTDMVLRFNFLEKEMAGRIAGLTATADISSLEMTFKPSPCSDIVAEIAHSSRDDDRSGKKAFHFDYSANLRDGTRVQLTRNKAEQGFAGYLENLDNLRAWLVYPLGERVKGFAGYSQSQQDADEQKISRLANSERRSQAGMNFLLNRRLSGSVELEKLNRHDRFLPADYDYDEVATRFSLSRQWQEFSLRLETRKALRSDNIVFSESSYTAHSYYLSYRRNKVLALDLYGGFTDYAGTSGYGFARDYSNIGFNLRWVPVERLECRFLYLRHYYEGRLNRSSQGDLSISYEFDNSSRLSLRARNNVSWFADAGQTFYELALSLPLDIATGIDRTVGAISGVLVDGQNADAPLEKIAVDRKSTRLNSSHRL